MGFDYSENSDGSGGVHGGIMRHRHNMKIYLWVGIFLAIVGGTSTIIGFLIGG